MRLLAELKRRNVIRMAGLYLVGAWLIVQVAATLLPTFDAPAWVMKVLVALLAIGFLAAMVFSWLYELTPEGLKRDGEVDRAQSIAALTARRMDRLMFSGCWRSSRWWLQIATGRTMPGRRQRRRQIRTCPLPPTSATRQRQPVQLQPARRPAQAS